MKIIISACFLLCFTFFINAQKTDETENNELSGFLTVPRSGWTTPVFVDENAEIEEEGIESIEAVEVQKKYYKLPKIRHVSAEVCSEWTKEKSEKMYYTVRSFWRFEYKGRVFAYETIYIGLIVSENSIQNANCIRRAVYMDEDGDGKFELRCQSYKLDTLPQWVKNLNDKESEKAR